MSDNRNDRMDRLLTSIGEESNAAVPFDRLHDGVLLAKKRAEKKRLARVRSLTAAASFAILLGAGVLFAGHLGLDEEASCDTAAPMAMETLLDNGPADAADCAAAPAAGRYSDGAELNESESGSDTFLQSGRDESAEPEDSSPAEYLLSGSAPLSGTASVSVEGLLSSLAREAQRILICNIVSVNGDVYAAAVTEELRGTGGAEIVFTAPEGSYTPGRSYLLLLTEAAGALASANAELIVELDGETAAISGPYEETLPTEQLLAMLELD